MLATSAFWLKNEKYFLTHPSEHQAETEHTAKHTSRKKGFCYHGIDPALWSSGLAKLKKNIG